MSPQIWHQISNILLAAGVVFLLLTIALSIKFQLVSIIRDEFLNRKNSRNKKTAEGDYFGYAGESSAEAAQERVPSTEENAAPTGGASRSRGAGAVQTESDDRISATVPARRKAEHIPADGRTEPPDSEEASSTVLVGSAKRNDTEAVSNTVVVASGRKKETNSTDNDFIITENIIVIHGNPLAVRL